MNSTFLAIVLMIKFCGVFNESYFAGSGDFSLYVFLITGLLLMLVVVVFVVIIVIIIFSSVGNY